MSYDDSFLSKRDRRRMQIQTKLEKLSAQFNADKDYQYREALVELQYRLSSLHQGDNPVYSQKVQDQREQRDYELLRLRLSEEYTVKLINDQFTQQYNETVSDANRIVSMVKQKLHDGLVQKIRQLKEDKALIDIVTSSSSSHSSRARSNLQESSLGLTGTSRTQQNAIESNGNTSGMESSTSFFFSGERRSRRKRENDFSIGTGGSNDDSYDSATASGSRKRSKNSNADSSANEDGKVITENVILNEFLYGPYVPKRKEKTSGLGMRKGHIICPSLKVEEVNEDLTLLRNFKRSRRG